MKVIYMYTPPPPSKDISYNNDFLQDGFLSSKPKLLLIIIKKKYNEKYVTSPNE